MLFQLSSSITDQFAGGQQQRAAADSTCTSVCLSVRVCPSAFVTSLTSLFTGEIHHFNRPDHINHRRLRPSFRKRSLPLSS